MIFSGNYIDLFNACRTNPIMTDRIKFRLILQIISSKQKKLMKYTVNLTVYYNFVFRKPILVNKIPLQSLRITSISYQG